MSTLHPPSDATLGAPAKIQRRYHSFGRFETARLFLSYQRYAALLFLLGAVPLGATAFFLPGRWWAWVLSALVALKAWSFAVHVFSRWPGKLRVTAVAQRRMDAGRFDPSMVRSLCTDPCFRVVAAEILSRSRMSGRDARALLKSFSAEMYDESHQAIVIDHRAGRVLHVEGTQRREVKSISPNPQPTTHGAIP